MNNRINDLLAQIGVGLKSRRPLDDDDADGYLESDDDYISNNSAELAVLLDGGLQKFAELIIQE